MPITYPANHYKILLFLISLITFLIYLQGVNGPFLFDDAANLSPMAINGGINSYNDALGFVFNNHSGPLGRPIAMASFLLNGDNWPVSPTIFKATNICIHLLTGWSIFIFIKLLLARTEVQFSHNISSQIALITASIWLLHPLHISTTLYVIQRMAQLSTLFSILTLIIYLYYLPKIVTSEKRYDFIIPSIIIFIMISLAVLSKENALLIFPVLLLVNNWINEKNQTHLYKIWLYALTLLPIFIMALYLVSKNYNNSFQYKGFSSYERLLSEFRVVTDYLLQIILPHVSRMSLFHDDMEISKSLFEPITTLTSALFLFVILSLLLIKIPKLYKFSIAWFFIWHILESTILPLDLYYEHRNYIASIGPILAFAYMIVQLSEKPYLQQYKIKLIIPIIIGSIFAAQLSLLSNIWSKEDSLYMHWLTKHEKSKMTLLSLVQFYEKNNNLKLANLLTQKAIVYDHFKNKIDIHVKLYIQQCALKQDTTSTTSKLKILSKQVSAYTVSDLSIFVSLIQNILEGNCVPNDIASVKLILDQIENYSPQRIGGTWLNSIQTNRAMLFLYYKDYTRALDLLKKAYHRNHIDIALAIIDININLSNFSDAQNWITIALKDNSQRKIGNPDRSQELSILQSRVENHLLKRK